MSKAHRLAWAAGFIDGDGFITISKRVTKHKEKIYNGLYIKLGCCQASKIPLLELQSLFGGSIRDKNSGPNPEGYKRKQQYIWTVSTKDAANIIEQLLPYLIHKKEVAMLALEFQNTMATDKQKLSLETETYRYLLKDKIQAINAES